MPEVVFFLQVEVEEGVPLQKYKHVGLLAAHLNLDRYKRISLYSTCRLYCILHVDSTVFYM